MPAGRPTKFQESFIAQAEKLCELGATDQQMADFFEVSIATINNWKHDFPQFLDTIKNSKLRPDDDVVESLFQKAKNGDTTAMIFWLKNRQPKDWRDRREVAIDTVDSPFNLFITGDKDDGDTT